MLSAPNPFSFVLFGASGHLAKLKIYPAFYVLALKNRLPENYAFIGYARSAHDDASFRKLVEESVRTHMPAVNEDVLTEFLSHMYYHQGQYDDTADFTKLADRLTELESGWQDPVRLAYLSVPPSVFSPVLRNLCEGKVDVDEIPFRVVLEKPVGHNLASAEEILDELENCFTQDEVYLLDHYLGKEAVRNVYYLRYANPVLERLFKNTLIDHVEITASESAGLEGRAGYFDSAGTFRDMFQSHLLMVASLITTRLAEQEESFRKSLYDAMEQFYLPPAANLDDIAIQGQYAAGEVDGEPAVAYLDAGGVPEGSRTNTFAALKLMTRSSRWQGVPFYLRSGKRLWGKETRISIQFQEPRLVGQGAKPNRLDIILQGEAGMRFYLQTKLGGSEPEFRPLIIDDPLVCEGDCLPEHGLLLLEAIHGKKQWFLSFDEIRTAWRLIDPIQAHLDKEDTPLHLYPAGSKGPEAADEWMALDRNEWMY